MSYIFHNFFYQPLVNVLAAIMLVLPGNNLGVAIVVLTLIVNILFIPLTRRAKIAQEKTRLLKPEIERLKKQHKSNPTRLFEAQQKLYHEHGVSMRANIAQFLALIFIQLPLLIALYRVFGSGGAFLAGDLYPIFSNIPSPETIFLYFFDLTKPALVIQRTPSFQIVMVSGANLLLAFAAVALQYTQTKRTLAAQKDSGTAPSEFERALQTQAKYFFPGLIFVLCATTPAALAIYWTTQSIFAIVHESYGRKRPTREERRSP